jgi:hypothetical protein
MAWKYAAISKAAACFLRLAALFAVKLCFTVGFNKNS